jgi:hypothetical protein
LHIFLQGCAELSCMEGSLDLLLGHSLVVGAPSQIFFIKPIVVDLNPISNNPKLFDGSKTKLMVCTTIQQLSCNNNEFNYIESQTKRLREKRLCLLQNFSVVL